MSNMNEITQEPVKECCAICLETFKTTDSCAQTECCKKPFHTRCLLQCAVSNSTRCPLCRTSMVDNLHKNRQINSDERRFVTIADFGTNESAEEFANNLRSTIRDVFDAATVELDDEPQDNQDNNHQVNQTYERYTRFGGRTPFEHWRRRERVRETSFIEESINAPFSEIEILCRKYRRELVNLDIRPRDIKLIIRQIRTYLEQCTDLIQDDPYVENILFTYRKQYYMEHHQGHPTTCNVGQCGCLATFGSKTKPTPMRCAHHKWTIDVNVCELYGDYDEIPIYTDNLPTDVQQHVVLEMPTRHEELIQQRIRNNKSSCIIS